MDRPAGALVLVGGRSSRMGRDKAWLHLDGETLLERTIRVLNSCCPLIAVIATAHQKLPPCVHDFVRLEDGESRPGPLVALGVGLEWAAGAGLERVYLSGVDSPFLTTDHVQFMLSRLGTKPFAAPVENQHIHGLSAAIQVEFARRAMRRACNAGLRSLRSLFDGPGERVPVAALPDRRVVAPCNTPEQFAALVAQQMADGEDT